MKKKYQKPALYVENFSLSQSIATDCGFDRGETSNGHPTQADTSSCGWDVGNGIVTWASVENGCNDIAEEDAFYPVVCYNNPNGGANVFNYS